MIRNADFNPAYAEMSDCVDVDRRLWVSTMLIFFVGLTLRAIYVVLSGVPLAEQLALAALVLTLVFSLASLASSRLGFREAALAFRGVSVFMAAFPLARDMGVDVFHSGRHFSLVDDQLANLDRLLGFDWIAYSMIFDRSPFLWLASQIAYVSIDPQFLFVIVIIAYAGSAKRLYIYLIAQLFATMMVALTAALLPCMGAYAYLKAGQAGFLHHDFLTADRMVSSITWLRQDTLGSGGVTNFFLISFPSYHACCAVLFIWGTWTSALRWPIALLNLFMLAATPVHGSHYLTDLIGGALIAFAAVRIATFWLDRTSEMARAPRQSQLS